MRWLIVLALVACGDSLEPPPVPIAPAQLLCDAYVWTGEHTVSAVAQFRCVGGTVAPREAFVSLVVRGAEVGWRPHIVDCDSLLIDTYETPYAISMALVEFSGGPGCWSYTSLMDQIAASPQSGTARRE